MDLGGFWVLVGIAAEGTIVLGWGDGEEKKLEPWETLSVWTEEKKD